MYLFLLLALIIIFAILKLAWPLILIAAVVFLIMLVLSTLQKRKESKKANENIINATYTEREAKEE